MDVSKDIRVGIYVCMFIYIYMNYASMYVCMYAYMYLFM